MHGWSPISIGQREMTNKQSVCQNAQNQANDPQEKADHSQVAFPSLLNNRQLEFVKE